MNIGIIIHSQTGNTHSVAQKLQEKLSAAGHNVVLEQLKVAGEVKPGAKNVTFGTLPDLEKYEAIILGSPVQGFALSTVMSCYLNQVSSLKNKKVGCLITQMFPYPWMGGNRAVGQMAALCQAKGTQISESAIVNWSGKKREQKIVESVDKLSRLF